VTIALRLKVLRDLLKEDVCRRRLNKAKSKVDFERVFLAYAKEKNMRVVELKEAPLE
jgi:hypothetical protein